MSDVQTIIKDLLRRANVDASKIDVSAISKFVKGIGVGQRGTIRESLEDVINLFQIDAVESNGVLKFTTRGKSSVVTLTKDDLVPINNDPNEVVNVTRKQWFDLPDRIDLVFPDYGNEYDFSTESGNRSVLPTNNSKTVQTNVVLTSVDAKTIAEVFLDTAWQEKFLFSFNTYLKHAYLEPGDVITLTYYNRNWLIRLTKVKTTGSVLELEGISSDIGTYSQPQVTGSTSRPVVTVSFADDTTLVILDIPLVNEASDVPGYFVAVRKLSTDINWRYADIYKSTNNVSFASDQTIGLSSISGTANTILPSPPSTIYPDLSSVVTVTLGGGTLASNTLDNLLNGSNAAVLGDELLQFTTATLIGPSTYTLSGFLRGRRGTEWATGTHQIGERFVLLGSEVANRDISSGEIGAQIYLKAVSNGQTESDVTATAFTPASIRLKPFSPVEIKGTRDVSNNLTITWVRRSRIGGEWKDLIDVPLGEASESYQVDIMNGSTVVRTLTSTSPTASYSAANQTTDFGSPQSSLTVKVYQMSATVGRGTAGTATV